MGDPPISPLRAGKRIMHDSLTRYLDGGAPGEARPWPERYTGRSQAHNEELEWRRSGLLPRKHQRHVLPNQWEPGAASSPRI
eukprot:6805594-Prymnesium_polylepis.1